MTWSAALPGATLHPGPPCLATMIAWPFLFMPLRDGRELILRTAAAFLLIATWSG